MMMDYQQAKPHLQLIHSHLLIQFIKFIFKIT